MYDLAEFGNWEGHNILNLPRPIDQSAKALGRNVDELRRELAEDRAKLLEVRSQRVPPGKDTKILASWNGLMLAALAQAGPILQEPRYIEAGERAAGFLLDRMRQPDGRLWHGYKDGRARFNAYLDDYACVIDGLTRLFEATGTARWVEAAVALAEILIDQFADPAAGGFFFTGKNHEALIVRQKDLIDAATPASNAMAATVLLRLGALTGREAFTEAGRAALRAVGTVMRRYSTAAGQSLLALDFLLAPRRRSPSSPVQTPRNSAPCVPRWPGITFPTRSWPPPPAPSPPSWPRSCPCSPIAPRTTAARPFIFASTSPAGSRWWVWRGSKRHCVSIFP